MIGAGRALGGYLARTYRYTDPTLGLIWEAGKDLLFRRCWSQTHLLGQVVRLDHLAAVFRHFYDGREVDQLVREFLGLELAINRDTVELLEALVRACHDFPEAGSSELGARLQELGEWERTSREKFQQHVCALREALHARAYEMVGLSRPGMAPAVTGRALGKLPRHAAAAVLAVGMLNCGSGDQPGPASDAGGDAHVADTGIYEAPPPPMDSGSGGGGAGPSDSGRAGSGTGGHRVDSGVIEAPPPPMDSGSS
jgi:hypothetical protein